MRLKIPMTGEVIDFDPGCYKIDGIGISGNPDDPVRVVNLNLGGVSWRLVSIDLENDLMEIEVEAPQEASIPLLDSKGKPVLNTDGTPRFSRMTLTPEEKQQLLLKARYILGSHTIDEIYAITGDKRLVKPASVMEKYRAEKAKAGT